MSVITGAKGSKGGSSTSSSPGSPNTLRSAVQLTLVEALGEGKIKGLVDMVNPLKSIYMDGTAMMNADGSMNKNGVAVELMLGTPDQAGFAGNTRTGTLVVVEQQVKQSIGPIVRTISGPADRVQVNVRIPALVQQHTDSGDLTGTSLSYLVQRRASGGAWETVQDVQIINQKNTSPYNRKTMVERPAGTDPFDIRVLRSTPDSTDVTLQNDTFWESYTVFVAGKYSYPNTALVQLKIDSQAFGTSFGELTFEVDGLETDVPSNYNPVTKTYTGIWDGTFVRAWHSNPAWVFWDLVTNNRYGLGEFVDVSMIDKWTLYQIGQYCDQLVDSGFNDVSGNPIMEPRFTFNGVISNREEAYKVLQDITAAFRGMAYWSLGQVFCSADMPQDPVTTLTPANVIGGKFSYSGTALKSRHSVAMVSWNDPTDNYRQQVEVVQNNRMLSRYGWRQVEVAMRGCVSRGEAHRFGRWILDTEENETETVQFAMSWDGYVLQDNQPLKPGDIVLVEDPRKNGGYRNGGRLAAVNSTSQLVLDFPVDTGDTGYSLTVMLPSGVLEKRTIASFGEDKKLINLSSPLSELPNVNGNWILESTSANARRYRVMSIQEEEDHIFKVTALFNDPTKYARVEGGFALEPIQYVRPRNVVRPPINPTSTESFYFQNGVSHTRLTLSWQAPNDFLISDYMITADTPRGFEAYSPTPYPSFDVPNPIAGSWKFYISSRSITNQVSVPVEYAVTVHGWQSADSPAVTDLQTSDGGNTFTGRSCTLKWTNVFPPNVAVYPVTNIVRVYTTAGVLLRTERVATASYTYKYDDNLNDGGPRRSFRVDVTALNVTGVESAVATLTVSNPVPAKIVPTLTGDLNSMEVKWVGADNDYAGALVYASLTPGFTPGLGNQLYDGPNTQVLLSVAAGTWHVRVALYDSFGKTGLNLSDDQTVVVSDLNAELAQVVPDLVAAREDAVAIATAGLDKAPATLKDVNEIADQVAGILTQLVKDRDDTDVKHQRTHAVLSSFTDTARALVATEQTARADADSAEATNRLALQATVTLNDLNINAALVQEQVVRAGADSAQASQITTMLTQIGNNSAAILTEQSTRASGDAANAASIISLQSIVNNPTTGVAATASGLSSLTTTVNDPSTGLGTKASSASVTALDSTLNDSTTGLHATSSALSTLTSQVFDASNGLPSKASAFAVSSLASTVNNPDTGVVATATALGTLSTTVNQPGTGLAAQISTLNADVYNATTGLSQKGSLTAVNSVRSDVDGVLLKSGVIGTINGVTGGFLLTGVGKLDGTVSYVVEIGGSLIVNGSIAGAKLIANTITATQIAAGTITATEIAANTITAAKIATSTITAVEIAANTIVAGNIAAGTITADKLSVTNLAAIAANLGTVTAGRMLSPSGFTDFDLSNERLIFSDST